jgi:polar amino acid transport system substrate-binding protein
VGEKFGFRSFTTNAQDVFSDKDINAVFIATRHNTHAALTMAALEAGKKVFVEKPLTLIEDDLGRIAEICGRKSTFRLMVGFNRRFSPLAQQAREAFRGLSEPLLINYRINAGFIPNNHWIQTNEGGGRILGEVCHFVDFLQFMTDSEPESVFAECLASQNTKTNSRDNVAITIRFSNGSVGVITYIACGNKLLSKERIEVFGGEKSFIIHDFVMGEFYSKGSVKKIKQAGKGHQEEVELFIKAIREGLPSPISLESIFYTTATTFRIIDALQTGTSQNVTIPL